METQGLVRLLRLELECNNYAVNTVREYTRLAGLFFEEHPAGVSAFTRENVARWISQGATQSRRRWRWLSHEEQCHPSREVIARKVKQTIDGAKGRALNALRKGGS